MSRRWMRWTGLLLAVALIGSLSLTGCKPSASGAESNAARTPQQGGDVVFPIAADIPYIDPYNFADFLVVNALFDGLTTVDPLDPTKILPAAAESWEANDDASVWTFRLRKDAKFADGTPVTAGDFVYEWNRMVSPNTKNTVTGEPDPSTIGYHLAAVKGYDEVVEGTATEMSGLKAVDDYTFEVTLSYPFADFLYVTSNAFLVPTPKALVEGGVDYNGQKVAYGNMPVGNGPFKMAEPWKHGEYIKAVPNDSYYGKKPYVNSVTYKCFVDPQTAFTEFKAGTVDGANIPEGQLDAMKRDYGVSKNGYTANPGEGVLDGAINGTHYLLFNTKDEYLKNPDLRRAISLAINRQAICDAIYEGTREPATNIVPPGIAGYQEGAWADARHDVDAAKQALEDAGYPGGKGLPPLKMTFSDDQAMFELIQADLEAIGIKTTIGGAEAANVYEQFSSGDFQIGSLGWMADYSIMDNFLYPMFQSESADNVSKYENASVDSGLVDARKQVDQAARIAAYQAINEMVQADNPVSPITHYRHNYVISPRLNDYTLDAQAYDHLENAWVSEEEAAK